MRHLPTLSRGRTASGVATGRKRGGARQARGLGPPVWEPPSRAPTQCGAQLTETARGRFAARAMHNAAGASCQAFQAEGDLSFCVSTTTVELQNQGFAREFPDFFAQLGQRTIGRGPGPPDGASPTASLRSAQTEPERGYGAFLGLLPLSSSCQLSGGHLGPFPPGRPSVWFTDRHPVKQTVAERLWTEGRCGGASFEPGRGPHGFRRSHGEETGRDPAGKRLQPPCLAGSLARAAPVWGSMEGGVTSSFAIWPSSPGLGLASSSSSISRCRSA